MNPAVFIMVGNILILLGRYLQKNDNTFLLRE